MVVFCCLPGADGTETEHGRDDLVLLVEGFRLVLSSVRTSRVVVDG
jgi:hypothetical protein